MDINKLKIGVIGLGYVGLPLAVEFGRKYPTVGFDIKAGRVAELEGGNDSTLECSGEELASATHLTYTTDVEALRDCNFYVVTVPTPIGDGHRPLLTPLRGASNTLGKVLAKGDIVVYESTVYPGCTEEFCVPLLEESYRTFGRPETRGVIGSGDGAVISLWAAFERPGLFGKVATQSLFIPIEIATIVEVSAQVEGDWSVK